MSGHVRVAVDAVDDDGALDTAGVVFRDADAWTAHHFRRRIELLYLDVHTAPLKHEPVSLLLNVGDFLRR